MGELRRKDFIRLGVRLAMLAGLPPNTVPKIADALELVTLSSLPKRPAHPDRIMEMLAHLSETGLPGLKKMGRTA